MLKKGKNNLLNYNNAKYELKEITEPNLFRDIFPYTSIPVISFDNEIVPTNLPDKFWITDTTFRDGQQARPPYTVKQTIELFKLLHKLGGKNGVIKQSEFFLYSEKDKEAVTKCLELGYQYPEITGWIRAVKSDLQLVKEMGLKETGILTSASDYHIFLKLKKTRAEALEDYLSIVKEAINNGIIPRCHFEDITRADFDGFVLPFAEKLMELSEKNNIPVKIRACDTMGYGVPYVEAALPRSVPKIIYSLNKKVGVPSEYLEWHGHNDFFKGLINATTAWLYGCAGANGTLLGFGERTGNTNIEGLIIDYISFTNDFNGIDTTVITEIAEYYKKELNVQIPKNAPFIGSEFNITRAGIHADGILKNEEIYNIFDTTKLLNRPIDVLINDKSGVAGIAVWINKYFKLKEKINKRHPGILKIYDEIMKQYEAKRTTDFSNEEMEELVKKHIPELFNNK
ncbi:MAG TPA: 2-isopropylmalate synthase [bacterium]|nr:2-isopropylmalate synthase [bacterium]HOL46871.1 2-isopropylmalate synthase [bacterium]HPQ18780.1 2-isopropylmalate synthase [bacterium]